MKIQLTVEVDGTYDQCEEVCDQLDELIADEALLVLGPTGHIRLLAYEEVS